MMAAAAATRARGGTPRRPFAPVVVSPSPPPPAAAASENRLAREDASSRREPRRGRLGACAAAGNVAAPAVLGTGTGSNGKAAKKCGSESSPVRVSSEKTPAAAKRAPGTATRRRRLVDSCAKNKKSATPAAACAAPRAGASDANEERDGEARAELSYPCSDADQERRGSEAERAMRVMTVEEAIEGRVKYLVEKFERLLLLSGGGGPMAWNSRGAARRRRRKDEATVSAPATPRGAEVIDVSYPSSEASLPVIPGDGCIRDASDSTRTSRARGQQRQRPYNSTASSDKVSSCSRKKVTRVTPQQPFVLRTEQRGKAKEGSFLERLKEKQAEEERLRHPVAQGLPYTTDEPVIPVKPPTKEPTEPIDLVLHSDVRVIKREEFDRQVAERISFMEEVKLERERQQKVDEEIEIKQLRKELVPRAHPVPDFSKPFVPKKSVKHPTIPREPRFQPRWTRHVSRAR